MHMFGVGRGWLGEKAAAIGRKHGAELVNYTAAQCTCGYGCAPHECERSRRHWFEAENCGEPFNSHTAAAVLAELSTPPERQQPRKRKP